jgi:hypothetical protein
VERVPWFALDPPPGYVAFVARNLAPVREEATRMVGDEQMADRLYPDALTDVAVRWGWLEVQRRRLNRPDAAEEYLRRALARRWQSELTRAAEAEAEADGMVDIQVLGPDQPLRPWIPPGASAGPRASAAMRLAPQLAPTARPAFGPVADAAVAWWHAYETRRRRRWLVALVAVLVLVAFLFRLTAHGDDNVSLRAPTAAVAAA